MDYQPRDSSIDRNDRFQKPGSIVTRS